MSRRAVARAITGRCRGSRRPCGGLNGHLAAIDAQLINERERASCSHVDLCLTLRRPIPFAGSLAWLGGLLSSQVSPPLTPLLAPALHSHSPLSTHDTRTASPSLHRNPLSPLPVCADRHRYCSSRIPTSWHLKPTRCPVRHTWVTSPTAIPPRRRRSTSPHTQATLRCSFGTESTTAALLRCGCVRLGVAALHPTTLTYRTLEPHLQDFAKGETIAVMSHATPSQTIRYSTVQVSENDHIELNSE